MILCAAALTALSLLLDAVVSTPLDRAIPVDTARTYLATIAGTMVTATVVVFWIRGLLVTSNANRFPGRVLSGYLRDRYQQTVMGVMIALFVAASIVLLWLPDAPAPGRPSPDMPVISVLLAAAMTVVALLVIVQSIDTGVRSMHEQRLLGRLLEEAISVIDREYPEHCPEPEDPPPPSSDGITVRATQIGWVRSIDDAAMLRALPAGSICRRDVRVGEFVTPATRICRVETPEGQEFSVEEVERAITLGETRSPTDDIAFALRSMVDVALSGLAAGSTDRTTAREAVPHIGAVLRLLVIRDGPAQAWSDHEDRWMVVSGDPDHVRYLNEAFEDLRREGRDPLTAMVLLATIEELVGTAIDAGKPERARNLRRQAELIVEQAQHDRSLDAEMRWIQDRASEIPGSDELFNGDGPHALSVSDGRRP